MTPLWFDDPLILMKKNDVLKIYPTADMNSNQKLNSIVRAVIILSIFGYVITQSFYIPIIALITMVVTVVYGKSNNKEGMTSSQIMSETIKELPKMINNNTIEKHTMPTKSNPLMNVQLTEINDNPTRKSAAPSYNPVIQQKIDESVKANLDPRLFKNVGDEVEFEHSMQRFYSTPNTSIPNDQAGFAEYCYGTMSSCRGGDDEACVKNNYRHILR